MPVPDPAIVRTETAAYLVDTIRGLPPSPPKISHEP
jgi:hypothetical protein